MDLRNANKNVILCKYLRSDKAFYSVSHVKPKFIKLPFLNFYNCTLREKRNISIWLFLQRILRYRQPILATAKSYFKIMKGKTKPAVYQKANSRIRPSKKQCF